MSTNIYQFDVEHLLTPTRKMIHLWQMLRINQFSYWDENAAKRFVHLAILQGEHIFEGIRLVPL